MFTYVKLDRNHFYPLKILAHFQVHLSLTIICLAVWRVDETNIQDRVWIVEIETINKFQKCFLFVLLYLCYSNVQQ